MSDTNTREAVWELNRAVQDLQIKQEEQAAALKEVLDILQYLKTSMKFINFLRKGTMWLAAFVIALAGMWDAVKRFLP